MTHAPKPTDVVPLPEPDTLPSMIGEYLVHLWNHARAELRPLDHPDTRPRAIAALAALAVATLIVLYAALNILDAIGRALTSITWPTPTNTTVDLGNLPGVITTPVRDYLTTHATGLPLTPEQLWWTWCGVGIAFFLIAVTGNIGARIGWTLYGAATTAIVLTTTPDPAGTTAAALTATTWAVLSIPAYRRTRTRAHVLVTE